jgi:hypothetical protein
LPAKKTTHKPRKKEIKLPDLGGFEFTLPVREQVVEDMYEESLARDKKREQPYIV